MYRAKDGMLLGVCLGLARSWNIPVAALRILAIILVFSTGVLPGVGLYLLAGVLLEPEPSVKPRNAEEAEFYDRFRHSRSSALHELRNRVDRLDSRLRGMEDRVTRNGFDWDRRFHS